VDLLYPSIDHHPSVCPSCNAPCIFFTWKDRLVQIIPDEAPPSFAGLVRWAQVDLDEVEFVELLVSIDELAEALQAQADGSGK